jgi:hypothetical protein
MRLTVSTKLTTFSANLSAEKATRAFLKKAMVLADFWAAAPNRSIDVAAAVAPRSLISIMKVSVVI